MFSFFFFKSALIKPSSQANQQCCPFNSVAPPQGNLQKNKLQWYWSVDCIHAHRISVNNDWGVSVAFWSNMVLPMLLLILINLQLEWGHPNNQLSFFRITLNPSSWLPGLMQQRTYHNGQIEQTWHLLFFNIICLCGSACIWLTLCAIV